MFSEITGSLRELDETQRAELAELTRQRIKLLRLETELSEHRLAVLYNPTQANEERMKQFDENVVAPVRKEYASLARRVIRGSVDVEGIQEALPMLALAFARHVNLPMLLTAAGFNSEAIDEVAKAISTFVKKGLG